MSPEPRPCARLGGPWRSAGVAALVLLLLVAVSRMRPQPPRLGGPSAVGSPSASASAPGPPSSLAGSSAGATRSPHPSASSTPHGPAPNATVTRVVDGDTIQVRFRGRDLVVRLIGIDTPESVAPGVSVQCHALAASRFTTQRLDGRRVHLEFDVERIDKYGRTLAYVRVGRELFNETLAREGYAYVTTYPPDVRYVDRFLAAQREARAHDRGVWGHCVHPRACDPAYPGVCIPPPPPDLDCSDISYRRFAVKPPDPHRFDADHNGIGCESA